MIYWRISAFYSRRSVAEFWTNPSPWNIYINFWMCFHKLLSNIECSILMTLCPRSPQSYQHFRQLISKKVTEKIKQQKVWLL